MMRKLIAFLVISLSIYPGYFKGSIGNNNNDLFQSDITEHVFSVSTAYMSSYRISRSNFYFEPEIDFTFHNYRNRWDFSSTPIANFVYIPGIWYVGTGVGLGFDYMFLDGYTNFTKWTIDFYTGIRFGYDIRAGIKLRHKSHSFLSNSQNIGLNSLMFELAVRL